jgi:hypothetical protein
MCCNQLGNRVLTLALSGGEPHEVNWTNLAGERHEPNA